MVEKYNVHLAIRGNGKYRELNLQFDDRIQILPLYEGKYPDWSKLKNLIKLDFRYFLKLRQYVIKNKIDLIYAHDATVSQAAIVKLLTRKPLVWHNHNGEMLNYTPVKINKYRKFLFNTDAIISVSEELTQFCKSHFNKTGRIFRTIPNFVLPDSSGKETTLPGGFNVLSIGNIRKVKNQLLLLRAFIKFRKIVKYANLIFVGKNLEEDYVATIRQEIYKNELDEFVFLLGSRSDIHNICKQANIGVLASEHEGFGLVLLEYGLANLPIVSSNISICKRILNDGLYGHLFNNGDEVDLAEKMHDIFSSYTKSKERAEEFRKHVMTKYTSDVTIKGIVQVFEEVAKHG